MGHAYTIGCCDRSREIEEMIRNGTIREPGSGSKLKLDKLPECSSLDAKSCDEEVRALVCACARGRGRKVRSTV